MSLDSKLRVLVICPGRSGTLSTKQALKELLKGKILHYLSPDIDQEEWFRYTKREADGDVDEDERKEFFGQFSAAVGIPVGGYWKELIEAFPDAKIILLKREPDKWFQSLCTNVISALQYYGSLSYYLTLLHRPAGTHGNVRYLLKCYQRLLGRELNFNREQMLEACEKFYGEVEETLNNRGLSYLSYDVKEGWEPLCEFLDITVPDEPFPRDLSHANGINDWLVKLRRYQVVVDVIKYSAVPVMAAIVYYHNMT